ncbi:hypothetical protein ACFL2Q_01650 [Thermodesulfobacteriota bacterium]
MEALHNVCRTGVLPSGDKRPYYNRPEKGRYSKLAIGRLAEHYRAKVTCVVALRTSAATCEHYKPLSALRGMLDAFASLSTNPLGAWFGALPWLPRDGQCRTTVGSPVSPSGDLTDHNISVDTIPAL